MRVATLLLRLLTVVSFIYLAVAAVHYGATFNGYWAMAWCALVGGSTTAVWR